MFFSNTLSGSANSVVGSSNLVTKVYFPRLIIPIASFMPAVIDFVIAFVVLLGMMVYYGLLPTANAIWLPFFLLLALTVSLGVGLWLAALNVKYRDIRHAIPFMIQFWFFATPIAYSSSLLDETWRVVYGLNPMVSVIEGFRWALLNGTMPSAAMLITSSTIAVILLFSGAIYFQNMERDFADIV
jgi:lipopolysaccharide transport system permease protein